METVSLPLYRFLVFAFKYVIEMTRIGFRVELPSLGDKIYYFQLCALISVYFCFFICKMEIIVGPSFKHDD